MHTHCKHIYICTQRQYHTCRLQNSSNLSAVSLEKYEPSAIFTQAECTDIRGSPSWAFPKNPLIVRIRPSSVAFKIANNLKFFDICLLSVATTPRFASVKWTVYWSHQTLRVFCTLQKIKIDDTVYDYSQFAKHQVPLSARWLLMKTQVTYQVQF